MNEDYNQPEGVVRTDNSGSVLSGQEARSVQEYRLDFSKEIRELRISLTGIRYTNGEKIKIFPKAMICEQHFSEIMPLIHMSNTKAWTLSRIHEEKAEMYTIADMDVIDRWIMSRCFDCEECNINGEYSNKALVMMTLEDFFYGNKNRAVGGFEANNLAQMQQITSTENYLRSEKQGGGFLSNVFKKRR